MSAISSSGRAMAAGERASSSGESCRREWSVTVRAGGPGFRPSSEMVFS